MFKAYIEGLKEGLTRLLQDKIPSGDKVLQETHDENKRNVNHDFRYSSFGLKKNHILKIDMSNFDSKDPITCNSTSGSVL